MPAPTRKPASSSAPSTAADPKRRGGKGPGHPAEPGTGRSRNEERLHAENEALRAEVERLRARYERPVQPPVRKTKVRPEPEPEQFALVGPGDRERDHPGPSDEALDSVGEMLCRILEGRKPETRWSYYRDELLVPDGVTFFYSHDALRKMWGETPGNPEPHTPRAYRRMTAAERKVRDTVLQAALSRVDEALERSQNLHAQGNVVGAGGLLKYVDLLLARFNLALARAQAGNRHWQDTLNESECDAEFERWRTQQAPST
jgi:hypothetical protein